MSKELEYEFNNFANLLNKDCMNLMEYLKKQGKDNKPILYLGKHFKKIILPYEEYQKMYNRLEAIDNANPSEALECLEEIIDNLDDYADFEIKQEANEYIDTIKQALLKAQEPKQYLKWEDLEFKKEEQTMKVLLNGERYLVKYVNEWVCGWCNMVQITNGTYILCTLGNGMKQFFNDLHLERVEE